MRRKRKLCGSNHLHFYAFPNYSNGILDRSGKVKKFRFLLTSFIFVMSASVYEVVILLLIVVFSLLFGLLLKKV